MNYEQQFRLVYKLCKNNQKVRDFLTNWQKEFIETPNYAHTIRVGWVRISDHVIKHLKL